MAHCRSSTKLASNFAQIKHKHCGTIDESGFRTGRGCEKWYQGTTIQKYSGGFVCNNLQNRGFYLIEKDGDQTYYDGSFYLNKLEGYGRIIYANGSVYEGLFKQHFRFGPGVFTYSNNSQDVGMWEGFSLRRIFIAIGQVPRIATSSSGEAILLKYRKLVSLTEKLDVNSQFPQLRCLNVRNPESLFFPKDLYKSPEDLTIDVAISAEEFEQDTSSILSEQNDCQCFKKNIDNFEHLCLQLHNVEIKIDHLVRRKHRMEKKLIKCENLYKQWLQENKAKIDVIKSPKKSSGHSSSDPEEEWIGFTHSEIELHNFLYTTSDANIETKDPNNYWSKATLPFTKNYNLDDIAKPLKIDFEEIQESIDLFKIAPTNTVLANKIQLFRKQLNSLIQEEKFYNTIKKFLKVNLDLEFANLQNSKEPRFIKKVLVTDLLSWNNEEIWTEMLKHSFYHRNSENRVTFNIKQLLTEQRKGFLNAGSYETACVNFLSECLAGNDKTAFCILSQSNINPDLCDRKGNTGVILATAEDKVNVIAMLANCGAKLDIMNDECLTALNLCLLRYISTKFGISDWEKAFLKEILCSNNDEVLCWGMQKSFEDIQTKQTYFFDVDYVKRRKTKSSRGKKTKKGKKKKNKVKSLVKEPKENTEQLDQLDQIKTTFVTLLHYGANPNLGELPLKPIFLAIFSDDSSTMQNLLQNNVNPNTTTDLNLTSLHVIASLKPTFEKLKMFDLLLTYKADPNIKSNPDHWIELKNDILGAKSDIANDGKNVLHLLCLREDFMDDVENFFVVYAYLLISNGCKTDDFYLGHTPLSLAVLRGNVKLVETLVQSDKVDPHQVLGNQMGNALTVLILNRFSNVLSIDTKLSVAETLFDNGLNSLVQVGDFENVIAFMENEENLTVFKKNKESKNKSKKSSSKSSKSKRSKDQKSKEYLIRNLITETSRKILYRHIQGRIVQYLLILMQSTFTKEPIIAELTKFLKLEDVFPILQLFFEHNILNPKKIDFDSLYLFFALFGDFDNEELNTMVDKCLNNGSKHRNHIILPEVDPDLEKYKICYQCLKGKEKKLHKCPKCELVYFCSEQCNKINVKFPNDHNCNVLFYNSVIGNEEASLNVLLEKAANELNVKRIIITPLVYQDKQNVNNTFLVEKTKMKNNAMEEKELKNIETKKESLLDDFFYTQKPKLSKSDAKSKPTRSEKLSKKIIYSTKRYSRSDSLNQKILEKHFKASNQKYYMELLSKIFVDFNLPLLLLPYACFKDGQVYYTMTKNTSSVTFNKLNV